MKCLWLHFVGKVEARSPAVAQVLQRLAWQRARPDPSECPASDADEFWESCGPDYCVECHVKGDSLHVPRTRNLRHLWQVRASRTAHDRLFAGATSISVRTLVCSGPRAAEIMGTALAEFSRWSTRGPWVALLDGQTLDASSPDVCDQVIRTFAARQATVRTKLKLAAIPPRLCKTVEQCASYLESLQTQA